MTINLIQPTWEATLAGTILPGQLFQQMATVERAALGFLLGKGRIWDESPPKLGDNFPEVTRWVEAVTPRDLGQQGFNGAHRGSVVLHDVLVKILFACAPVTPEWIILQQQYEWVPLAWTKCYAENRTLDGMIKNATLTGRTQWATAQRYGGNWYTGWIIPVQATLRYAVGAS